MPTSSQARILSREYVTELEEFTRMHGRSRSRSEGSIIRGSFPRTSVPLIHQRSRALSYGMLDPDPLRHRRLPVVEFPSWLWHHKLGYVPFDPYHHGNVSNNWPTNVENEPEPTPQGTSQNGAAQPVESQQPGTAGERSGRVSQTKGPPGTARKASSKSEAHRSRQKSVSAPKKSVDSGEKSRTSSAGTSRRKRESTMTKNQTIDTANSDEMEQDASFQSPDTSVTLEIDLLKDKDSSSGSHDLSAVDTEQEPEQPEPQAESEEPRHRKRSAHSIRALYKQLLSIGMSANAFRGVVVHTAEGVKKQATEEEAEAALNELASGMVDSGAEATDENEDDEDEGEMELLMGSLLSDVGHEALIEVGKTPPAPAKVKKETPVKEPPKEVEPGPPTAKPELPAPTSESVKPVPAPSVGPGLEDISLPVPAPVTVPSIVTEDELGKILATDALPPIPHRHVVETSAEDKDFLKQVVAGSLYKGGTPKKPPPKPKDEEPKKKVLKVPPIRLRRVVPVPDPKLLCIRTPNVDLTHVQVKNMLEAQLGNIVSLQHDPEYLQSGDVNLAPRVMWIFKMEDTSDSNYTRVCLDGIVGFDGEKLRIRKRDDVCKEEYRAFVLVQQIKAEQTKRMKNKGKSGKGKSSTAKTSA